MKSGFSGCRERLKWIDHALRTLDEDFRVWMLENDPNPITVEYQPEADVHLFRLGSQLPPSRFGIVAGNIVHQVRATLDNLIWQLVIANGKKPTSGSRGNQFPIIWELKGDKTFADYTMNTLAGVHPDHVAVVDWLQPYHSPDATRHDHPLAMLARLSNTDKHQVLQVTYASRPKVAPVEIPPKFVTPTGISVVSSEIRPPEERHAGAIIGWAYLDPSGFQPDVEMQADYWGGLSFEGASVVTSTIISTLTTISAVVWWSVGRFTGIIERGEPLPNPFHLTPELIEKMRLAFTKFRNVI